MSDWSVGRRLATFGLGLLVAFGAGFGIGELGNPIDRDRTPAGHDGEQHDDPAPAPSTTSTTESPYAHQHDHVGGGR